MSKPASVRVPSDDFVVEIGGQPFHTHEGEWVEVLPQMSVRDMQQMQRLNRVDVELDALAGEDGGEDAVLALLDATYADVCRTLAARITDWTWTDDAGRPLPKPDGTAEPFRCLTPRELMYLNQVLQDDHPAARGKDSNGSPTTSSATAPPTGPTS